MTLDRFVGYTPAMLPPAWASSVLPVTLALVAVPNTRGQERIEPGERIVSARGVVLWDRARTPIDALDAQDSLCIVGVAHSAYPPSGCGIGPLPEEPILPGRAAVYAWDGASWLHRGELVPIGSRDVRGFGHAVAIDGRTAVVSTNSWLRSSDEWIAEAYVFEQTADGHWDQVLRLFPDAEDRDLGECVEIGGGSILIGAPGRTSAGAVCVLERADDGTYRREADLVPPEHVGNDDFGASLDLRGALLAVGSPEERGENGGSYAGAAYVYERLDGGWRMLQRLTPADPQEFTQFGDTLYFLAEDELLVVTALRPRDDGAWKVHCFRRTANGWIERQVIENPSPTWKHYFGMSVAGAGNRLYIGAASAPGGHGRGLVHVYAREIGGWMLIESLCAPASIGGTSFGRHLAMDGASLLAPVRTEDGRSGVLVIHDP